MEINSQKNDNSPKPNANLVKMDKSVCEILQSLKDKNENGIEFVIESSRFLNWTTHNSFILIDDMSQFITYDIKDNYLQINFKSKLIELYGYKINSSINSFRYMRNWALLGSTDRVKWIILDEHCDDDSLQSNDSNIITFSLYPQGIKLSSVKLIQTGKNNKSDDILAIRYFDLIGKIFN